MTVSDKYSHQIKIKGRKARLKSVQGENPSKSEKVITVTQLNIVQGHCEDDVFLVRGSVRCQLHTTTHIL